MILGVTPARGASKGIPRKNIRSLCGKPLDERLLDVIVPLEECVHDVKPSWYTRITEGILTRITARSSEPHW